MLARIIIIASITLFSTISTRSQPTQHLKLSPTTKRIETNPGRIINISFFIENSSESEIFIITDLRLPEEWRNMLPIQKQSFKPKEKKLNIISIQVPSGYPAGNYRIIVSSIAKGLNTDTSATSIDVKINEVQNITMNLVQSPAYIMAGEKMSAEYLLQNYGNTTQKVYIETRNCQMEGSPEITLAPGESKMFFVFQPSSAELTTLSHQNYSVRALLNTTIIESIFKSYMIFPVKEKKQDLYLRYPVKLSTNYLASNLNDRFEHIFQAEVSGSGALDPNGKHQLNFLARHSSTNRISHLGLHDQYFISYKNKNFEVLVGENSYMFTPLTESSRYGLGFGARATLNSGFNFGIVYVKPQMYEELKNEMAVFSGLEINERNKIDLYLISKTSFPENDNTHLASLSARVQPIEAMSAEVEYSYGKNKRASDHAIRLNVNTHFSFLNLSGDYFYTGANYPGYFSNSTFYSGNISVRLSDNLNLGISAREDFKNAQLDTFFVTAPYSKYLRSSINYKLAQRAHIQLFWNQNERKDRLSLDKFHYKTNSINAQYNHTIKRFEYNALGEVGETTNFLSDAKQQKHTLIRGLVNLSYKFNSNNIIKLFGNYTNINRFISPGQQNFSTGISALVKINQQLKADFHLQNSYAIEDYYRNRNLMQFNINYTPAFNHEFGLRSYYTLFKQKTEDPELTLSLNYTYKLGVPIKKVLKAGELRGTIVNNSGAPYQGVMVSIANRTAVTDKNGSFVFKSIPSGRQHLIIDNSIFAIDELPEISDYLEVDIPDNDALSLHLKITKGSKVNGQFVLQQEEVNILQKDSINIRNIIIELTRNNDSFRITSNGDGKFSFPLVRPGDWTLKIYTNSLPEGYDIEEQLINILLTAGDNHFQEIILKPKKRTIIFKPAGEGLKLLKP